MSYSIVSSNVAVGVTNVYCMREAVDGSFRIGRDNAAAYANVVIAGNLEIQGRLTQTSLTSSDVGLGNVINVLQIAASEKAVANGVATLDETGLIPLAQLPANIASASSNASGIDSGIVAVLYGGTGVTTKTGTGNVVLSDAPTLHGEVTVVAGNVAVAGNVTASNFLGNVFVENIIGTLEGSQGPQGAQGAQGPGVGAQGAEGPQGVQGPQGAQGAQGIGAQGSQGPQGVTGAQGPGVGAQGAQGPQGDTGSVGPQGSQGVGAQGAQGPQGVQGAQGPGVGAQGPQGAQGVAGSGSTNASDITSGILAVSFGGTGSTGAASGTGNVVLDTNPVIYGNLTASNAYGLANVNAANLIGNIDMDMNFGPSTVPATALYGTLSTAVLPNGMSLTISPSTTFSIASLDANGYYTVTVANTSISNVTTLDTGRVSGGYTFQCAGVDAMSLTGSTTLNGFDGMTLPRGSAQKPGGGSWASYSDRRVKMNISDARVDQCYDIVKSLPLQRFEFVPSYVESTGIRDANVVGWIADDVEAVFPKAVTYTKAFGLDDMKTLDVDQLYKTMWGAVTKLIHDKEQMDVRLAEIERRINYCSYSN